MGLFYTPVAPSAAISNAKSGGAALAPSSILAAPSAQSVDASTAALARPTPLSDALNSAVPGPYHPPSPSPAKLQLSLARLGLAVGFLVVILAVGLIASVYKIEPWNSVLPSAFQLLVGAVIGAVIGEHIGSATST